jgi:hypothetical protein
MGRRSGIADDAEALNAMTLDELNLEIERVQTRLKLAPNTYHRKSFFSRLAWLEAHRESVHGIPAPKRTLRARQD